MSTKPNYLIARTGSPAERAMVAAENALRVPIELSGEDTKRGRSANYDEARFKVMAFTKEAMDALDDVSQYDQVTLDTVRRKIGKAQERAGLQ